jgi:trimethylamine--corrinoid protein Co-methyltransferase
MANFQLSLLSSQEIQAIHKTSIQILNEVGVTIPHSTVLEQVASRGARVDFIKKRAQFDERLVQWALGSAGKRFCFHGREKSNLARFGAGEVNLISSPGQYAWFDDVTGQRRDPVLQDAKAAARVGNALSNVTIVGAMSVPTDVPPPVRDVVLTAEMVKETTKPTRCWPVSRASSRYVLEIYAALAGGKEALRNAPMVDTFLEPISPLQLPYTGLDILLEYLEYGQPISIGPMAMVAGTGPGTLAGTLAQENAEILAGLVVVQALAESTPVIYGGIPHIMDPRTSICSFGSPEQGLMAIAMAEIGKSYGLPVYINVNLTDAKTLDAQAGMEKMSGLLLGMLAGADLLGHGGIVGTDHGGSLPWLVLDDEAYQYARRIQRGLQVGPDYLAGEVVAEVGPGGNFLTHKHTLQHYRQELWVPGKVWSRDSYEGWVSTGSQDITSRAQARVDTILRQHQAEPLDPQLSKEIDRIVATAHRELVE